MSHITAFEYWRLVGTAGVPVPHRAQAQVLPLGRSTALACDFAACKALSHPLHGLTSKKARCATDASVVYHFRSTPLPCGAVFRISERVGIVSPELALIQVASALSIAELIGLMCEFCGLFTLSEGAPHGLVKRSALTNSARLRALLDAAAGSTGVVRARRAAKRSLDRSRSPMETAAALQLTLPCLLGGSALDGALLNSKVELGRAVRRIAGCTQLEPDIYWPQSKVCVEYDSAEFHCDEHRMANDARRKNALVSSGCKVVTLTKTQLYNFSEMKDVAKHVARLNGTRLRSQNPELLGQLRGELLSRDSVIRNRFALSVRMGQVLSSPTCTV